MVPNLCPKCCYHQIQFLNTSGDLNGVYAQHVAFPAMSSSVPPAGLCRSLAGPREIVISGALHRMANTVTHQYYHSLVEFPPEKLTA
jgi:hypothetical protein